MSDGAYFYRYEDGLFVPIDEVAIEQQIERFDGRYVPYTEDKCQPLKISHGFIQGTLKRMSHNEKIYKPDFFKEAPAGIVFGDQFARVTAQGISVEPASPEHRARFGYPFALPEWAPSPLLDSYYETAFLRDSDKCEKVMALEEIAGAILLGFGAQFEKIGVNYGATRSGKTTWSKLVIAMLLGSRRGEACVTALQPDRWGDIYALGALTGSLLNYLDEVDQRTLESSTLKRVSTGSRKTGRWPGGRTFDFNPRCFHLWSANTGFLPKLSAADEAAWERFIIIYWPRNLKAEGIKLNENLPDNIIKAELPQFIRRALEGGVRLLRQGGFTLPESHFVHLYKWRAKENVIPVWDALCLTCAQTHDDWIASLDAHKACSDWCRSMGSEPPTPKAVGMCLTQKYGAPRPRNGRSCYPVFVRNAARK